MFKSLRKGLFRGDPWLALFVSIALILGTINIFNTTFMMSMQRGGSILHTEFSKHLLLLTIGIIIYAIVANQGTDRIKVWSVVFMFLLVVACVLVLIPGIGMIVNGSRRWLNLGLPLQPSEILKPVLIVFLAYASTSVVVKYGRRVVGIYGYWRKRIIPFILRNYHWLLVILVFILIERQPDLGTAFMVTMCAFGVFIFSRVRGELIILSIIVLACAGLYFSYAKDYRADRMSTFLNRWDSKIVDGPGYQQSQSELAMALGGVTGIGIAKGRAKHVIPAAGTDFAFTTPAEELGIIGSFVVIATLACICIRLFQLASNAPTEFSKIVLGALGWWIAVQSVVNMLVTGGKFPTVGVPLPFFSYGGSSLIALMIGMGVAQSLAFAAKRNPVEALVEITSNRRRDRRTRLSRT